MASICETKRKNGQSKFRVLIRKKGLPYIEKVFSTRKEAEYYAISTELSFKNALEENAIPNLPLKVWLHRYSQEVLPTRAYKNKEKSYLEFWEKNLGSEIAIKITSEKIEFIANLLYKEITKYGTPISYETRRKYLLMLSSIYTYAMKNWKWTLHNPLTGCNLKTVKKPTDSIVCNDEEFINFKKSINKIIQERMKEKGLSQRELAKKCEMALQTVQYSIDSKNNPTIKNLMKILKYLNISLEIKINDINGNTPLPQ